MGALQRDLFPWSEEYQVGIAFADVQHKQLVDIINRLYQAWVDGKARPVIGRTLDELIRYTTAHFAAEEKVLQSCGYPDFPAHHSEHERLAYAILEFYQRLMSNELGMTAQSVDFLRDWLGQEILDVDMKFAPFLKGKGVP
jgi:hemerythrin-like metal-binding protein